MRATSATTTQAVRAAVAAAVLAVAAVGCGGGSGGGAEVATITVQPTAQSAAAGGSVTFSVAAGVTGAAYRWQLSTDAGATWADIANAVTAQLTVAVPTLAMNGWQYRAIVSAGTGAPVASVPAALTVSAAVGQVLRDCADCPELVALPRGSFRMGVRPATDVFRDQASPVRTVSLAYHLALGRSEVTRGEFARFVQATAYRTDAESGAGCLVSTATATVVRNDANWRSPGFAQTDTDPVVCVSWNDAQAYVAWLNSIAPVKTYRLASEAEWEYAARAGVDATRYPWGDDLSYSLVCSWANSGDQSARAIVPRFVNAFWTNCADGYGYTAPTSGVQANAFGLRHMLGNAWEWVQDGWHPNYNGAPTDGSVWVAGTSGNSRIYRGGSWNNHPTYLDPAYRASGAPTFAEEGLGFRVARAL